MKENKRIKENAEAFEKKVKSYFKSCDVADSSPACFSCKDGKGDKCAGCAKRRVPYTLSGLCLSLGMTKREFLSLRSNKCFSNIIDMALLKIESYVEENSCYGNISSTFASAVLKEHFGWGKEDVPESVRVELSEEADGYGG